jgi:hypothetical protein
MESKLKHLEFIQTVITRMNTNSFLIKGWTITIVSALFVLAAKDSNVKLVFISYLCITLFWILDGFYLSLERKYRCLYNQVIEVPNDKIDFKMNTSEFNLGKQTWLRCIFSKTLSIFYCVLLIISIIITIITCQ